MHSEFTQAIESAYFISATPNTTRFMSAQLDPLKKKYLALYEELINDHKIARGKVAQMLGLTQNGLSSRIKRDSYVPDGRDLILLEKINELYRQVGREAKHAYKEINKLIDNLPDKEVD